jgi:simple sugar transport system permease protein
MNASIEQAASTRYKKRSALDQVRGLPAGNVTIIFIAVVLICCIFGIVAPQHFRFASTANLDVLMRAIPTLGITALGMGLLMIAGEFDLSIGATFGLSSYVMVMTYTLGYPIFVGVALAFAVAVVIGLINGFITVHYGIPSFITTLGTLFIFRSGARLVSNNKPLMFAPPEWFHALATGNILGLQMQFLWFVALAILAWLILNRHTLGNHFFAVGGNPMASNQVGINVRRTKIAAFVWCASMAAAAGVLSVTRVASANTDPQVFMELEAVAACVMGGIALTGGRGSVWGIVVGAIMFHLVKDIILLARLPGFYLDLFVGLVIVFGVTLNQLAKKRY